MRLLLLPTVIFLSVRSAYGCVSPLVPGPVTENIVGGVGSTGPNRGCRRGTGRRVRHRSTLRGM